MKKLLNTFEVDLDFGIKHRLGLLVNIHTTAPG
jgi:hypothetical protein